MAKGFIISLTFAALSSTSCASAEPVTSVQAACAAATAQVTAQRHLPISHVAVCDDLPEADSPEGYYLLALRAHCFDEICGSTNMGWFAVQKATGSVFEWDLAESKAGPAVSDGS